MEIARLPAQALLEQSHRSSARVLLVLQLAPGILAAERVRHHGRHNFGPDAPCAGASFLDHGLRRAMLPTARGNGHRTAACLRGPVELWKNSMPLAREDVLALELIVDIADGRAVRGRDLARRVGLKPRSLEQLLQRLARNGILVGQRGGQGGYRLARDAALISASDVVRAARKEPPRLKFIRSSSAVRLKLS